MPTSNKKNKSIEAKLIELEEILEDLESGKLELDDALKKDAGPRR